VREANVGLLVIASWLEPQSDLDARYIVDRHEVHRVARRDIDTEDVRKAQVGQATSAVIRGPTIEDEAALSKPRCLALDSEKHTCPDLNNQIKWLAFTERDKNREVALDKCAEDRRLCGIPLGSGPHGSKPRFRLG
jgi:hypothetical protein